MGLGTRLWQSDKIQCGTCNTVTEPNLSNLSTNFFPSTFSPYYHYCVGDVNVVFVNLLCAGAGTAEISLQHTISESCVAQLIADTTKPDSQLIIQFCDGPGSGSGPDLDNGNG